MEKIIKHGHSVIKTKHQKQKSGYYMTPDKIGRINFSRKFTEDYIGPDIGFCSITSNDEKTEVGFLFTEDRDDNQYKIRRQGKKSFINAKSIIRNNPLLNKLLDEENPIHRRQEIQKKEDNFYLVSPIPHFSESCHCDDLSQLPKLNGIYSLYEGDECIYIGSGILKDRVKNQIKSNNLEPNKIECKYDCISDRNKAYQYESYHLKKYQEKYLKKPKFNLINAPEKNEENNNEYIN